MRHKIIFYLPFLITCAFTSYLWSAEETLAEKAKNPISQLEQLQFENDFTPNNYGSRQSSNNATIKPIIPFNETEWFPFQQVIRFKFQIPTLPKSSTTYRQTALGDTQFFDLLIFDESWGRWGIGPVVIFPTASSRQAGAHKWQIGPAFGISIRKFKDWQIGFIAQNPISCAGNHHYSRTNALLFQPILVYHFSKDWYLTSNAEWTIEWIKKTQQIPIDFGIGHVFTLIGTQEVDTSLQLQWMAYQNAVKSNGYVNQFTIQFSFNLLLGE